MPNNARHHIDIDIPNFPICKLHLIPECLHYSAFRRHPENEFKTLAKPIYHAWKHAFSSEHKPSSNYTLNGGVQLSRLESRRV